MIPKTAANLSPKQRRCAALLAQGYTCRLAAQAIGVTPGTISEWHRIPAFRLVVEQFLLSAETESIQALQGLRLKAVETLGTLLESGPAVAIRSALAILQVQIRRPTELLTISQRDWQEMLTAMEVGNESVDVIP